MTDPLLLMLLDRHNRTPFCSPGETLLIGCSGGADSLSLAHAMHAVAPLLGVSIISAYVHHGLRPEADEEAEQLSKIMAEWSLPHYTLRIDKRDPSLSPEEALRDARYRALNRLAEKMGAAALLLGHHADDQIETILWRLTKGSGSTGLLGMAMVRSQQDGPSIIRPWLETPRWELEAYLRRHGLTWFEDRTNQDLTIPRNLLRHHVLPILKDLNPALHRTMGANQRVMGDEEAYLNDLAQAIFASLSPLEAPGLIGWAQNDFLNLHPAMQRRILAIAYEKLKGSRRGMSVRLIDHAREAFMEEGKAQDLGQDLHAMAHHGLAMVYRPIVPCDPVPAELGCKAEPWGLILEERDGSDLASIAFDADQLPDDLVWREAHPQSDRFTPWGHQHAHSLEHFLAKAKIPSPLRARLPVLAARDEVLWIPGLRRGAMAPILPLTRRIVRALQLRQAWFDNACRAPYHESGPMRRNKSL